MLGCQAAPRGGLSEHAAAEGPGHGCGDAGSLGAPPAAAPAPRALAEGRDTACRHCPSKGHSPPAWAWGARGSLEDKWESGQMVVSDNEPAAMEATTVAALSSTAA